MSKVTVIVPIYNVEEYVAQCFDSLLRQTFEDFVVFAVNDGSPKNEQAIIDEYAARYPHRIIPIRKQNGGYGSVLQLAIAQAQSEYFLVCDPDDTLSPDALATLVSLAEEQQADLVIGAKTLVYSDGSPSQYDPAYNRRFATLTPGKCVERGSAQFEDLLFVDPSPHAKLYRRSLASAIRFPQKIGYTDNLLFYISLLNAQRVVYTDAACAFYLIDRAGNTMTDLKPKVIDAHAEVFMAVLDQAQSCREVPALFYYRIYEAFKFSFYQLRRIQGSSQQKQQHGWVLYELVKKLMPYRAQILAGQKKYGYSGRGEQLKDRLILTPGVSRTVYGRWMKEVCGS